MNEICQRNGTKKTFPELNDMPFKMESMGTEKTYAKGKIHEISKPKEKGTLKPFRKKKKQTIHKELRIKIGLPWWRSG